MSASENVPLREENNGGYSLAILAKFQEPFPVSYMIRVTTPQGAQVDFISTLDGFKNIGELLMALHYLAENKLYPRNTEKLNEVLTADTIKNFGARS
jgi:hypothetical protein